MQEVQTGDRVGEYVLREKLGEGGFGVVWKAENPDLPGKMVAIKVAKTQENVALLKSEGEIQHKLRHPGIVPTLSLNMSHDPPYIVRTYVQGESLRARLDNPQELSVSTILGITVGVLEALAHAHSKGVTHGDLSPANVILDRQGKPHVLDFGLSSTPAGGVGNSIALSVATASANPDKLRGTLVYLAPERRAGNAPSRAADIFSAGLMAVEMINRDPVYLRFPIPRIPGWFSAVLEKATTRDPACRFAGVAEMLKAIRDGQAGSLSEEAATTSLGSRTAHGPSQVRPPTPPVEEIVVPTPTVVALQRGSSSESAFGQWLPKPFAGAFSKLRGLKPQMRVVLIGGIVFVGMGLFPPWKQSFRKEEWAMAPRSAGYSLLFMPPAPDQRAFGLGGASNRYPDYIHVEVDLQRLLIQWAVVIGASLTAFLLLHHRGISNFPEKVELLPAGRDQVAGRSEREVVATLPMPVGPEAKRTPLGPTDLQALVGARRMHHYAFAHQALPKLFFANPARLVATFLDDDDAVKLLTQVWDSVGDAVVADGLGPKLRLNGLKATLEWVGSRPCALVQLPRPAGVTEAYFVAAVLNGVFDDGPKGRIHTLAGLGGLSSGLTTVHPDSARLAADAPGGFYFALERSVTETGEWRTCLCSWDKENRHLNFGDGPGPEPSAFLREIRTILEQGKSPNRTTAF